VLIDFDIAYDLTEYKTDECVGTIPYIAPEMIQGDIYSTNVDMWSLGVIITEKVFISKS
jgi:serine/threonine protein kinase